MATFNRYWFENPGRKEQQAVGRLDGDATGISAALWATKGKQDFVFTKAIPDIHMLEVLVRGRCSLRGYRAGKLFSDVRHTAGQSVLIPAGPRHNELRSDTGLLELNFYLPQRLITDTIEAESFAARPDSVELIGPTGVNDARLELLAREVMAEMRDAMPFSRLRLDALGQDVAIHVLRSYSNLATTTRVAPGRIRGGLPAWQTKLVCDWMMACVEDKLAEPSVAELAAAVGLRPAHFCRAFALSIGVPPYRWMLERRIERAKVLMSSDPLRSLTDIALDVGYANQSSLGRAFHRLTGVSPNVWRRLRR